MRRRCCPSRRREYRPCKKNPILLCSKYFSRSDRPCSRSSMTRESRLSREVFPHNLCQRADSGAHAQLCYRKLSETKVLHIQGSRRDGSVTSEDFRQYRLTRDIFCHRTGSAPIRVIAEMRWQWMSDEYWTVPAEFGRMRLVQRQG